MKIICTPIFAVPKTIAPLWQKYGSLAQLVQSICLTSRGSAVRSRQLPLNTGKGFREMLKPFFIFGLNIV